MSTTNSLLGILSIDAAHGYALKQRFDELVRPSRPLAYGQVYGSMARIEKAGWCERSDAEPGAGPDRRGFRITDQGQGALDAWFATPVPPEVGNADDLFAKVVLAVATGHDVGALLDVQRDAHHAAMRDFTRRRRSAPLDESLLCDHHLFRLDADLRWLELTEARLDEFSRRITDVVGSWGQP